MEVKRQCTRFVSNNNMQSKNTGLVREKIQREAGLDIKHHMWMRRHDSYSVEQDDWVPEEILK